MAIQALDLIKGACRPLNVLTGNTSMTPDETADALQALNWMLDSWSNEDLTLYHMTRETFTLTSGLNPHTWGTGANLNSSRPTAVMMASVTVGGVDYPVSVIGWEDWEMIGLKTLQTAWPQYVYYEPQVPNGNLYTWPINTGNVMNFQSEKVLGNFATLYDVVTLPPGYADAIRYNLALRLAPEYQITAGADLVKLAEATKKAIMHKNGLLPPTVASDKLLTPHSGSTWNVFTDGWR